MKIKAYDVIVADSSYDDQLISRSAPRWAWAILDETLGVDARSSAFSADLRADIIAASTAVQLACDRADDEPISRADVDAVIAGV